ncbi:hypothetical protein RFI_38779 [Reticulomyxa filosa]|uniref:Uncharacterized protein n=1 Tax=Reticulomyxa filosa TaxID=46433 RepID=X6LAZ5_RETFI|nr:hypothetical protein RFI_38779 [Reticulomyxa filosa]|eukprot:ETN98713.1 hypothetical protein RFI_38779 [Reticulomyxa filosa]
MDYHLLRKIRIGEELCKFVKKSLFELKEMEQMQVLRDMETRRKLEEDICAWTVPMEYRIRTKKNKKINKYYERIIKKNILLDEKKNRVCKVANEFTIELMEACRYEENCPFSQVYGAILGGCLQNRLAICHKHNSIIIFLFQLDKNNEHDLYYAQKMQERILDWICKYFKKRRYSERSLWIIYGKCEFNILVAFTYEKQKYCQFNFKENKQYLRLFNSGEVEKIAHNLMSNYNQYKHAIQDAQIQDIDFLNQNMSTVFTILRTYYIREDHIGTETRLAILVLKAWKYYLLRRKMIKILKSFVCMPKI